MSDGFTIADPGRWTGEYNDVTRKLLALLDDDERLGKLLGLSLEAAANENGDPETNPVRTVDDYVRFVDRTSRLVPKDVLENPESLVRDEILQTICYFYFLVDQELDELAEEAGRDDMYRPTLQYYPPFAEWVDEFADSWGSFLATEASWNWDVYRQFYADPRFGLQKGWYEPASFWNTFNQFFSRYLASPDVRPIAGQTDPALVTSPADSTPRGVWEIDENSRIRVDGGVDVKHATYYDVSELVGERSRFGDAFAGGTFTHTFLNVNDYHRYHFPVGGTVEEVARFGGNAALEVEWHERENRYEPVDSTGWQFTQTRGLVVVDTGEYGLVALLPMGMAQVSAVEFEDEVRYGNTFSKGDMLGTFLFGGSDFVMLFQEQAGFEEVASKGEHLLMGEEYGRLTG